jgi:hypothetical protein
MVKPLLLVNLSLIFQFLLFSKNSSIAGHKPLLISSIGIPVVLDCS